MRRPPTQHILESEIGCTIHTDGSNIGRKKISNTMMTTPIRGKDGKVFSKNILLNLTEECIGGSKQHFQSFLLEIRRLVLFTAKDVKDDTLEAATKLFASKIRYMNSDGASEMRKLATFIQSWQEMFGVWLKYLSHVVEGFEKEADKLLCDWEASTKVYKRITNDWT